MTALCLVQYFLSKFFLAAYMYYRLSIIGDRNFLASLDGFCRISDMLIEAQ